MKKRKLGFGQYSATEEFRAIKNHSCVCFLDDMGLVAVTGPADDKDSQEYAELFAVAPELLEVLKNIVEYRDRVGPLGFQLEKLSDHLREAEALIEKVNNHG